MKKYVILLTITAAILMLLLNLNYFIKLKKVPKNNNIVEENSIFENNSQVKASEQENIALEFDNKIKEPEVRKSSTNKIPILMYHSIEIGQSSLYVHPKTFENHINYLINNNYNFIDFEDLKKGNIPSNPIIITFDDGYDNIYTNVYPLLNKYKAKATVFVITDTIGKQGYLSLKEISEMNHIISFQSHTLTHKELTYLDDESLDNELKLSKERLQSLVSNEVLALSYPCGKFNNTVINITKKYYNYGISIISGNYNLKDNPYKISRIRINKNDNVSIFKSKVIKQ